MCMKLTTIFISSTFIPWCLDNRIKSWDELDKLRDLPEIENVMLVANPFYEQLKEDAKYYALKKVPQLKNIDGFIV